MYRFVFSFFKKFIFKKILLTLIVKRRILSLKKIVKSYLNLKLHFKLMQIINYLKLFFSFMNVDNYYIDNKFTYSLYIFKKFRKITRISS